MRNEIERYWHDLGQVACAMPLGLLESAAQVLLECHRRGGTVFVLGNGGRPATAPHLVCDLGKGTRIDGRLARLAELTIRVPARSVEQVEDAHLAIAHSLCVALRVRLHTTAPVTINCAS